MESAWRAGNPCGSGCARATAVQGRSEFSLIAPAATFLSSLAEHAPNLEPDDARVPEGVAFKRFGRPPPLA
jgi:hypothetical protein